LDFFPVIDVLLRYLGILHRDRKVAKNPINIQVNC